MSNVVSQYRALFILMISGLLVVSQVYMLIPLMGLFEQVFSVSGQQVFWVISAYGFAYAGGFLLAGPLSDVFGRKNIMVSGLALFGVVTFLIGYVHSFALMIVLRVIQGFAASSFPPTAMAYVGELSSDGLGVIGLSFLIMFFTLSSILGQVYGSVIAQVLSWQWSFWIVGILSLLMMCLIIFKVNDDKKVNLAAPITDIYKGMLNHLKNSRLLPLYATTFIVLMSFVAVYSVLGHYLKARFGLDPENIILIRVAGIPSVCLSPVSGYFSRKLGGSRVSMVGISFLIVGLIGEALAPSLALFTLSSAIFDAGIAVTSPAIVSMVNKIADHARASAMSLYTFFLFVGAGLGPLVDEQLIKIGLSGICFTFVGLFILCVFALQFTTRSFNSLVYIGGK